MQWTGERNGEYRATFPAPDQGMYAAQVEATRAGKTLGTGTDGGARHAERRRVLRRDDARASGCSGLPRKPAAGSTRPRRSTGMPEDLRYTGRGVTTVEERELWHMPIVLIVLLGLVCAEWGYRRATGLA